jgi:hypothetical protein
MLSYPEISSAGEVLSVLVERDGHDTVSGIECFLHTITVMNVNVDVQNTLVVSKTQQKFFIVQLLTICQTKSSCDQKGKSQTT